MNTLIVVVQVSSKLSDQLTTGQNNNIEPFEENFIITTDEAFSFLTNVLGILEPEKKLEANREAFVGDILKAMHHHIPWQTVKNLATPENERRLPTLAEIKEDVIGKLGGLCYTFNLYGMMLLRALGYKVSLVPATVINNVDCHLTLIVSNLTCQGSEHMVDFGAGPPTFRPIPFDFEEMSPEYTDSFLRYRFVRQGETIIRQHTIESDPGHARAFKDFQVDDKWFSFFFIHANRPVNVAHFTNTVIGVYTDPKHTSGLLTKMYCCAYPKGRFVCIKDTTLLVEDGEGRVQKSYFRSRKEIFAAFERYFSQFPQKMIKAAMEDENITLNFRKCHSVGLNDTKRLY